MSKVIVIGSSNTDMVFETPNLPAEFWDDAIARTVEEFPQFKINKIVPPNVGSMGDYLKQLQATDQFPDVMMSNFAVAEFIEAGLLLPFEEEPRSHSSTFTVQVLGVLLPSHVISV